jgi:hypothetical protein
MINYFVPLLFTVLISVLHAAEKKSPITPEQDIFALCQEGHFTDDNYINWNMLHTPGRLSILHRRIGEIEGVCLANELLHKQTARTAVVQTTNLYRGSIKKYVFTTQSNPVLTNEPEYIPRLLSYIVLTELALLSLTAKKKSDPGLIDSVEHMRVHDLYLLTTIIQEDPLPTTIKDPQTIIDSARQTHELWRPTMSKKGVHSSSAYAVLQKAFALRKDLNLDAGNGDHYIWTFNVEQETKKEYERRLERDMRMSKQVQINDEEGEQFSNSEQDVL